MPETFSHALAQYKTNSQRHAAIIASWREHPSNAEMWRSLESTASKHGKALPAPADFISFVLGATMPASRLNDHSKNIRTLFERLKQEISEVVKSADRPLDLWRDLAQFETALRELDHSDYDMNAAAAGGRNDLNRSRDRKLFALRMLQYFENTCGQPLVSTVAAMLDIVFPDIIHDERLVRQWLDEIS